MYEMRFLRYDGDNREPCKWRGDLPTTTMFLFASISNRTRVSRTEMNKTELRSKIQAVVSVLVMSMINVLASDQMGIGKSWGPVVTYRPRHHRHKHFR